MDSVPQLLIQIMRYKYDCSIQIMRLFMRKFVNAQNLKFLLPAAPRTHAFCQSPHPPIMSVLHSGGIRRACSARVRQDIAPKAEIARLFAENFGIAA